jgi:hypothetical protein
MVTSMMKTAVPFALALVASVGMVSAQKSPPEQTSATIAGKTLTITYSAPSVRGREGKLFGPGGKISEDPNYPVWRAGANAATTLHTDADLTIGGLDVPTGTYTLFVLVENPDAWQLIINKQTGQWGLKYDKSQDLGRVPMEMSKPSSLVETLKYTIRDEGDHKGKLELAWENHVASVPITVR